MVRATSRTQMKIIERETAIKFGAAHTDRHRYTHIDIGIHIDIHTHKVYVQHQGLTKPPHLTMASTSYNVSVNIIHRRSTSWLLEYRTEDSCLSAGILYTSSKRSQTGVRQGSGDLAVPSPNPYSFLYTSASVSHQ